MINFLIRSINNKIDRKIDSKLDKIIVVFEDCNKTITDTIKQIGSILDPIIDSNIVPILPYELRNKIWNNHAYLINDLRPSEGWSELYKDNKYQHRNNIFIQILLNNELGILSELISVNELEIVYYKTYTRYTIKKMSQKKIDEIFKKIDNIDWKPHIKSFIAKLKIERNRLTKASHMFFSLYDAVYAIEESKKNVLKKACNNEIAAINTKFKIYSDNSKLIDIVFNPLKNMTDQLKTEFDKHYDRGERLGMIKCKIEIITRLIERFNKFSLFKDIFYSEVLGWGSKIYYSGDKISINCNMRNLVINYAKDDSMKDLNDLRDWINSNREEINKTIKESIAHCNDIFAKYYRENLPKAIFTFKFNDDTPFNPFNCSNSLYNLVLLSKDNPQENILPTIQKIKFLDEDNLQELERKIGISSEDKDFHKKIKAISRIVHPDKHTQNKECFNKIMQFINKFKDQVEKIKNPLNLCR